MKNSWKCWGFVLFSCWQLWFPEKIVEFCQNQISGQKFDFSNSVFYIIDTQCQCPPQYVFGKEGRITLEKMWSKVSKAYALQATRRDILVHDPSFTQFRTLSELFPDGSTCFSLAHSHYGCEATVLKIDKEHRGRVQVSLIEPTVLFIFISYCTKDILSAFFFLRSHLLMRLLEWKSKWKTNTFLAIERPKS